MTEQQQQRKIDQIARQSLEELEGWIAGIKMAGREPFDGEMVAIARRKRELMRKGPKA